MLQDTAEAASGGMPRALGVAQTCARAEHVACREQPREITSDAVRDLAGIRPVVRYPDKTWTSLASLRQRAIEPRTRAAP